VVAAQAKEAILVTPTGSLLVRTSHQFPASRKLGKTHQNVLVFMKGEGGRAARECQREGVPEEIDWNQMGPDAGRGKAPAASGPLEQEELL